MGLFDRFKKEKVPPEPTPEEVKHQSLLDFAMDYMYRGYSGNRPPGYADEDGGWEDFEETARPIRFAGGDFSNDGDYFSNYISQVPAEHVGGEEGETRYYGGAYQHPFRMQARIGSQQNAQRRPYYSVEDSIPAAEAHRLRDEWVID